MIQPIIISDTSFRGLYYGTDMFIAGKINYNYYINNDHSDVTISDNRNNSIL